MGQFWKGGKNKFGNTKNKKMKAITFNKTNECEKQEGISPEQIVYCGSIENITDVTLENNGLDYSSFFNLLSDAKEDEDFVLLIR
jgi:hypothetical protein